MCCSSPVAELPLHCNSPRLVGSETRSDNLSYDNSLGTSIHAFPQLHWSIRLFEILNCLSFASWNVRALFMHEEARAVHRAAKLNHLGKLLDTFQLVACQECHGNAADVSLIDERYPHFLHYGDFLGRGAGGVMTSVSRNLLSRCDGIHFHVLAPGRVLATHLLVGDASVVFVNVHIEDTGADETPRRRLLHKIRDFLDSIPNRIVVLGGDWNFAHSGDVPLYASDLQPKVERVQAPSTYRTPPPLKSSGVWCCRSCSS